MQQRYDTSRLSVLFVDDEEKSLKYFKRAFSCDFSIITASCAKEAEIILENEGKNIAVLITDQRMPEKSGIQLLHNVRKKQPHTIRMLTTAYSDLDDTVDAINNVGIYRYISKPWKVDDLSESLTSAMNLFIRQQRVRDLMEERKKSMLSLACSIAHELRVSLLKIGGTSWELNNQLPGLLDAYESLGDNNKAIESLRNKHFQDLSRTANDIGQTVDRGNAIIDMLLMNAADNDIHALLSDVCSMVEVVQGALQKYPFKDEREGQVTFNLENGFLFFGSGVLMQHVLFNLLKNAFYALADLGNGSITISFSSDKKANYLHFRDTGGGVAEADIPYIFDDFFSSKATVTNAGLGLAFCKRAMKSFGGDIICDSRRNKYTEFVLSFPALPRSNLN